MKFSFTSQPIDKLPADLLLLLQFQNQTPLRGINSLIDWRLNGRLSKLLQSRLFLARAKELLLMPAENRFKADKIVVLGLGRIEEFEEGHISEVFDFVFETANKMKAEQVALSLSKFLPSQFEWRNAVRLFVSKLVDYPEIREIIFCEPQDVVTEARRRQMDFGPHVQMTFDAA